jgi:HEPN domain-containing protein
MSAQIEHINAWISKADHDLGSAKIIYLHLPDYFDTIAFHCQQATEKYIKAILIQREIEFERSHDLIYLLELLPEDIAISDDKYKKAVLLNGFSVQIRYPNKIEHMTKEELEEAICIAEEFRIFAIEKIGIKE